MDIRQETDREIDAYPDRTGLVMLIPEDHWADFVRAIGSADARADEVSYRAVRCRRAAITAVIAQDGF